MEDKNNKKLARLAKVIDKGNVGIIEELDSLDTKIEDIDVSIIGLQENVKKAISIAEETKKQEGPEGKVGLKGDKGEQGIPGKDGKDGKNGKDGINGLDGIDGKDGANGKDGRDGKDGKDGKDGSPDNGQQIILKINKDNTSLIDFEKIDNIPFEQKFRDIKKYIDSIPRGGGGAVGGSSSANVDLSGYLKLDQTTSQTIINGAPIFNAGLRSNSIINVNLNTSTNYLPLSGTGIGVFGADNSQVRFGIGSFGIAGNSAYASRHARGTMASPSAVQNNDRLFSIEGWGYGTTGFSSAPSVMVRGFASQTWTDTKQGAYLSLYTTTNDTVVPAERMRILANGRIGFSTTAPDRCLELNVGTSDPCGFRLSYNAPSGSATLYSEWLINSSGNATIIGSHNAAGTLTLQATNGNGVGSEHIYLRVGNNGAITAIDITSASITNSLTTIITKSSNAGITNDRHLQLVNTATSGNSTWIDFKFGSSLKSALGSTDIGDFYYYVAPGKAHQFYTGLGSSLQLSAQINSFGLYLVGSGVVGQRLNVGNSSVSIPSTLSVYGSTGLLSKNITTANTTLDGTATIWLVDTTNGGACTGTPTYACSSYTNSTTCLSHNAAGCSWNIVGDCSVYNYNESNCTSAQGCTWETVSCSTLGDESTCNSTSPCSWVTCSYYDSDQTGCTNAGCTWNYNDCSTYTNDYPNCTGTSGCSWSGSDCSMYNGNYTSCVADSGCSWSASVDCSSYNYTDQATCEANSGCTWDAGNSICYGTCSGASVVQGTCSGQYNTSCTGDHCGGGSYATGNCLGQEGYCSGTARCQSLTNSSSCGSETGCTWTSDMNITLDPTIEGGVDISGQRTNFIKKIDGAGKLIINANTGQTIDGASTYELTNIYDAVGLSLHKVITQCAGLNETQCGLVGCSWNSESGTCSGQYVSKIEWYIISTV